MANYYIPISYLLKKTTKKTVRKAPNITKKTIEIGSKYSPDFVCLPFKYNLGNFIESLENGSNLLIQAGGGCRYGCYAQVQEKILRDLGYEFDFYTLAENGKITPLSVYKVLKKINPKLKFISFFHYFIITIVMIKYMDILDDKIRKKVGFEVKKGEFEKVLVKSLNAFSKNKGLISLTISYIKALIMIKKVNINKPKDCLRVGIIGELYTNMEPFSSYFIEKTLANMNVSVKRFTNLSYLLYEKRIFSRYHLRKVKKYLKYTIGADGMDNVYRCKYLIDKKYDGIIHIKPFGCTPEIGAIPIIDKICKDNNIPIIYFSFDNQNSDESIKTRLEALVDMLNEKRRKK